MEIYTLDLNFQDKPTTIASYVVVGGGTPVLIETGPGSTLSTLNKRLAENGFSSKDIRHVIVSHIHLDHAGAAGWWAQQGAQVYVHHVGAPHLIQPERLLASAARIYGDQMDRLWGEVLPAPAERVTAVHDGDEIKVDDLTFKALDTPGHAYHHHVFCLGDIAFIGDAAGIHLPGPAFVDLPAPPPEFHLGHWLRTIDRLLEQSFSAVYPTHFGRVDDWREHIEKFTVLLRAATEFVRVRMKNGLERDRIIKEYREWQWERATAAQVPAELIEHYTVVNPLHMSVDGIMRYWRKHAEGS